MDDRICVLQLSVSTPEEEENHVHQNMNHKVEEYNYPKMKIGQMMKKEGRTFFTNKFEFPKMTIKAEKNKRLITIINVYAPTSEKSKKFPQQIDKLYTNLHKLCKQIKKISTTATIIAGDFNSKIGRRHGNEESIGSWSRGRRNENGTRLVEFCENEGKIPGGVLIYVGRLHAQIRCLGLSLILPCVWVG